MKCKKCKQFIEELSLEEFTYKICDYCQAKEEEYYDNKELDKRLERGN